jgi:predicted secreted protein
VFKYEKFEVHRMNDQRSGKIVLVAHCILNVHSLEDDLAIYPGLEEDVIEVLIEKGVGIFQMPCPEMAVSGIFRKPLPKEAYEHTKIRMKYRELADSICEQINAFKKKNYEIVAVIGAEGSPTCGIDFVGKWKDPVKKGRFPDDVLFVEGMGVFMEELKQSLEQKGIRPHWIGIPGKSIRTIDPKSFEKTILR